MPDWYNKKDFYYVAQKIFLHGTAVENGDGITVPSA